MTDYLANNFRALLSGAQSKADTLEGEARVYRDILGDLASKVDGQRLDEMRRIDPTAPKNWGARDWKLYWEGAAIELPKLKATWGTVANDTSVETPGNDNVTAGVQELKRQTDSLIADMEKMRLAAQAESEQYRNQIQIRDEEISRLQKDVASLKAPKAREVAKEKNLLKAPERSTYGEIAEELARLRQTPFDIPRSYHAVFPDSDRQIERTQRAIMALYLIARYGLSIRTEIEALFAAADGLSRHGSSARNVFADLVSRSDKVVETKTIAVEVPFTTRITVITLTQAGHDFCCAMGWMPVKSEYARLVEGGFADEDILRTLSFMYHARMRGWKTQMLPPESGKANVLVEKNVERYSVWTTTATLDADWNELVSTLTDGSTPAFCGIDSMERTTGYLCADGIRPIALTDLKTLIFTDPDDPDKRAPRVLQPEEELWFTKPV